MKKNVLMFCCFISIRVIGQLPYTNPIYPIHKDSAVFVGTVTNYCNNNFDIKVNLYKPVGDNNLQRPVAIFVHGGGFTSHEDFNEYHMNVFAQEFAKRGYMGVSIDYREGHHLYPYGISFPQPEGLGVLATWEGNTFIYDTAESIRAIYRAQQDLKAVIRWVKGRHLIDSTSICKVFLGGHSAGAITVLTTAFMDKESEKPAQANALTNAPNPNWISDGFDWFGTWVVTQINGPQDKDDACYRQHNPGTFNYDAPACYTRPDLGQVDGTLFTSNGYTTKVMGVAGLAGAIGDTNILAGQTSPPLFLYHLPNDLVVNFNVAKPFIIMNDLLNPDPNSNWINLYGSNWINNKLNSMNYSAAKKFWVYDNGGNPLNTHDILPDDWIVADSVARFFAAVMDTSTVCGNVILPIAGTFNVSAAGRSAVKITWSEDPQAQIKYFILERSFDGINYFAVAQLNHTGLDHYQYLDAGFQKGINYYRLKTVYLNGTSKYSEIRTISFSLSTIQVYPNPARGSLRILFDNSFSGRSVVLEIFNHMGQKIRDINSIVNGAQPEIIDISSFPPGSYLLKVISNSNRIETHKFIISN